MDRRSFLWGVGGVALLGGAARAQYQPQGRALVARLVALQAEDGAVLMPGAGPERLCRPHAGNLAARGLLLGAPPRSRPAAAAFGKAWLRWYFAHLNADGTIDDHRGVPGALKPTGAYESADAPAGSFLSLAFTYLDLTGDDRPLLEAFPQLNRIAEAILVTLQKSGLTHARRDHPVAYLANNVEVWHGFDSFARLAERLRKRDEGREYRAQADALLPAIDRWFWDQAEGYYAAAVHAGGKRESGLGRWDPHWKANLRAIALLPGDERRHDLFARLARRAEPLPEKIETADDLEKLVGWGMAVLARHNRAALEQYQLRLSRVAWDRLKDLDPALLGQALHVGGGTVSPAPEPEE